MNLANLDMDQLRKTLPTAAFKRIEEARKRQAEETRLRQTNGACSKKADNGSPCSRYVDHPGLCLPSESYGEPTDTWKVSSKGGEELLRVQGSTSQDAMRAALRNPKARKHSDQDGGLCLRRLATGEL